MSADPVDLGAARRSPPAGRLAAASDVRALAAMVDREATPALLAALRERDFPRTRVLARSAEGDEAAAALARAIDALGEPVAADALEELAADYAAIFLNHALGASPCESVWIDPDGLAWQEPMFQVRAYYRKVGLRVPNWRLRADDHLVVQLHFVEILMGHIGERDAMHELARFLDEHLLRWFPRFAQRVAGRCATRFYSAAVRLAALAIDDLRDALAEETGERRPTGEEIDRRMKPTAAPAAQVAFIPGIGPSW